MVRSILVGSFLRFDVSNAKPDKTSNRSPHAKVDPILVASIENMSQVILDSDMRECWSHLPSEPLRPLQCKVAHTFEADSHRYMTSAFGVR